MNHEPENLPRSRFFKDFEVGSRGGAGEALRGPTRPSLERAGDYQNIKCGPHQPADKDGRRKRRCQFTSDRDYQETGYYEWVFDRFYLLIRY